MTPITTAENAPAIKASYWRLVEALAPYVRIHRFLFGSRPSLADFGVFGQLKTLATDTSPMLELREHAPMVEHWVRQVDDLSGVEGEWVASADDLPKATVELLRLAGEVYLPFLLANAAALELGAERVETEIDGRPWVQKPFPYQRKCLGWLRDSYAKLAPTDRKIADDVLAGTGCEVLFA